MKFRGIDVNGDWMFGQGIGSFAQGQNAIALDIAARVRSWKGNCFFDTSHGVDYTNVTEKGRETAFQTAMSNCIMQTVGVVQINSINVSINPRTRRASLTYDIQTIYTRSYKATLDNITGAS